MLRIIGGAARGRTISAPRGERTRPSAARLREALFSAVEARMALSGVAVLDLYAGSGALGLEALSRGAAEAILVDRHRPACAVARRNAARLGFEARCRVLPLDTLAALRRLGRDGPRHALVLADPPYALAGGPVLEAIAGARVVAPGGLVALEHAAATPPDPAPAALEPLARRRHGDAAFSLYRLAPPETP